MPAADASSATFTSLPSLSAKQVSGDLPATGPRAGFDKGDPQTSTLSLFTAPGLKTGVWECKPGGWPIPTRDNTECCHILEGRVKVTTEGGESQGGLEWTGWTTLVENLPSKEPTEFTKGDVFAMPKGWSGRWDVIETVRKFYVISD